jgi:hypothetical protein
LHEENVRVHGHSEDSTRKVKRNNEPSRGRSIRLRTKPTG